MDPSRWPGSGQLATGTGGRQPAPAGWTPPAPAAGPSPDTTGYAMWRLPDGGAAVPRARALVRGALAALGLPRDSVDDGELMACEIATNAVRHARGPYELRLYAFPDAVVCEVLDGAANSLEQVREALTRLCREPGALDSPGGLAGPGELTPLAEPTGWPGQDPDELIQALAEGGRGLPLVGRLCGGRCGARSASTVDSPPASGKAVWFTQARPALPG